LGTLEILIRVEHDSCDLDLKRHQSELVGIIDAICEINQSYVVE